MLILSRKLRQQIRIADDIVITVLQVKGGTVRLGIEAPCDVKILRGELKAHAAKRPTGAVSLTAAQPAARSSDVSDRQQSIHRAASESGGELSEPFDASPEHQPTEQWQSSRYRPSSRAERTAPLRRFMSVC
jgi:carbon storage regulator CsrA